MRIEEYIAQKKELHSLFLIYIESDEELDANFDNLINIIKTQKIQENQEKLRGLLHLISKVSKNHYRNPGFITKFEKILSYFKKEIQQSFTNIDIFNLFKSNKRILLFLFQNNFVTIDDFIFDIISKKDTRNSSNYCHFFYPEIKQFLSESKRGKIEEEIQQIEDFEQKRQIGENDSFICRLIRNDSVEDFISHVNRQNITLTSRIKPSIFETNPYLLTNGSPSLIEYATFFGSIQIFQYLKMNGVELTSSLWFYSIHGNNAEIIHLLEDEKVTPLDMSYEKCLKEAMKCHHNDIAKYIQLNLLDEEVDKNNLLNNFYENSLSDAFHYFNFEFFTTDFSSNFEFLYCCYYDYFELAKILLGTKLINLNEKVIRKKTFFFI